MPKARKKALPRETKLHIRLGHPHGPMWADYVRQLSLIRKGRKWTILT